MSKFKISVWKALWADSAHHSTGSGQLYYKYLKPPENTAVLVLFIYLVVVEFSVFKGSLWVLVLKATAYNRNMLERERLMSVEVAKEYDQGL